jgi:hypothetical protein
MLEVHNRAPSNSQPHNPAPPQCAATFSLLLRVQLDTELAAVPRIDDLEYCIESCGPRQPMLGTPEPDEILEEVPNPEIRVGRISDVPGLRE